MKNFFATLLTCVGLSAFGQSGTGTITFTGPGGGGSGGNPTTNASQLTAGTLPDARLSTNVVTQNAPTNQLGMTISLVNPGGIGGEYVNLHFKNLSAVPGVAFDDWVSAEPDGMYYFLHNGLGAEAGWPTDFGGEFWLTSHHGLGVIYETHLVDSNGMGLHLDGAGNVSFDRTVSATNFSGTAIGLTNNSGTNPPANPATLISYQQATQAVASFGGSRGGTFDYTVLSNKPTLGSLAAKSTVGSNDLSGHINGSQVDGAVPLATAAGTATNAWAAVSATRIPLRVMGYYTNIAFPLNSNVLVVYAATDATFNGANFWNSARGTWTNGTREVGFALSDSTYEMAIPFSDFNSGTFGYAYAGTLEQNQVWTSNVGSDSPVSYFPTNTPITNIYTLYFPAPYVTIGSAIVTNLDGTVTNLWNYGPMSRNQGVLTTNMGWDIINVDWMNTYAAHYSYASESYNWSYPPPSVTVQVCGEMVITNAIVMGIPGAAFDLNVNGVFGQSILKYAGTLTNDFFTVNGYVYNFNSSGMTWFYPSNFPAITVRLAGNINYGVIDKCYVISGVPNYIGATNEIGPFGNGTFTVTPPQNINVQIDDSVNMVTIQAGCFSGSAESLRLLGDHFKVFNNLIGQGGTWTSNGVMVVLGAGRNDVVPAGLFMGSVGDVEVVGNHFFGCWTGIADASVGNNYAYPIYRDNMFEGCAYNICLTTNVTCNVFNYNPNSRIRSSYFVQDYGTFTAANVLTTNNPNNLITIGANDSGDIALSNAPPIATKFGNITKYSMDTNGNSVFAGSVTASSFTGNGSGLTNIPNTGLQNLPLTNNQSGVTLAGTFNGNATGYPRYITNFSSLLLTNIAVCSNVVVQWQPPTNMFIRVGGAVGTMYSYGAQCRVWLTCANITGTNKVFPLWGEPAESVSMLNSITNFNVPSLPLWVRTNQPVTIAFVNPAGTNTVWYNWLLEQVSP